jgi:branched-chain amino acid transport system ATP-binding protein
VLDTTILNSPLMESRLAGAIKDINREKEISILITEQYARPLLPVIGYGYIMEHGAITVKGQTSELLKNPNWESAPSSQ